MAIRPLFVTDDVSYVRIINTDFEYFNGFSKVRRQRSVDSLHEAFKRSYPDAKLLEVSTFSRNALGFSLGAFNLFISLNEENRVPLELAFQAGKVFEHGGPYKDLLDVTPKKAKSDPRLSESGRIISFEFEGRSFSTKPAALFYTWLYI